MRTLHTATLWLMAAGLAALLCSCDPMASVEYKIYNKTADTVTVVMHKELLSSDYQGFDIQENDSVTTHYGKEDSISVAVLAPEMVLTVNNRWSGLYHEEQVIPLWKYITAIKVGTDELPAASWDNESAWHLKKEGGGRFEDEFRYYDLVLRNP